jgi:hypothetical protein
MGWHGFGEEMKQASVERRAGNRENSAAILVEREIAFDSKNDGAHLIVRHNGKTADFWPGTGKYSLRGTGVYRRGVFNLLRDLGVKRP